MTDSRYDHARDTVSHVYHDARDKAAETFSASKDSVQDAAHRAAHEIEANPLLVLAGGLALGVVIGALLPRSTKEKELLGPLGSKLGETARQAFAAAKDAGYQELDSAGLTKSAAKDRGKDLFDGVVRALSSAGTAAVQSARKADAA